MEKSIKKYEKELNKKIPAKRREIIEDAVKRTIKEYGKTLAKLENE